MRMDTIKTEGIKYAGSKLKIIPYIAGIVSENIKKAKANIIGVVVIFFNHLIHNLNKLIIFASLNQHAPCSHTGLLNQYLWKTQKKSGMDGERVGSSREYHKTKRVPISNC